MKELNLFKQAKEANDFEAQSLLLKHQLKSVVDEFGEEMKSDRGIVAYEQRLDEDGVVASVSIMQSLFEERIAIFFKANALRRMVVFPSISHAEVVEVPKTTSYKKVFSGHDSAERRPASMADLEDFAELLKVVKGKALEGLDKDGRKSIGISE